MSAIHRLPIRALLAAAFAIVAFLALPLAGAAAATHYAAPNGVAGNAPCTVKASPCDIETAVKAANLPTNDTLILAPGTYHPAGELKVQNPATVEGEAGQPAPLIEGTGTFALWFQNSATVRHLSIHAPQGTIAGLFLSAINNNFVNHVSSTGEAEQACSVVAASIRDSLCAGVVGFGQSFSGNQALHTELTGDTMIGSTAGIEVNLDESAAALVQVVNTIAMGGSWDVAGRPADAGSSIEVEIFDSNFSTVADEGAAGPSNKALISSPSANANQSAEPIFVDAAAGNYREATTSPTHRAGTLAGVGPEELDLDGNPRITTCEGTTSVDIGAYELVCPPPPSGGGGTSGGGSTGGGSTGGATGGGATTKPLLAPTLSKLALKPPRFKQATTISFTLSAAAKVNLEVLTRKKPANGKTKTVKVGTLPAVSGKQGANNVRFDGKLKGRRLAPGRYTLRATATASGLRSKPLTTAFQIRP